MAGDDATLDEQMTQVGDEPMIYNANTDEPVIYDSKTYERLVQILVNEVEAARNMDAVADDMTAVFLAGKHDGLPPPLSDRYDNAVRRLKEARASVDAIGLNVKPVPWPVLPKDKEETQCDGCCSG